LLIRRSLGDSELAYFTTWCPKGTSIETLVRVEGTRWRVEEGFETTKNELGLDHNESRSWHGWHRHISLVMLAYAVMTTVRYQSNVMTPKKQRHNHDEAHPVVGPRNSPPRSEASTAQDLNRPYPCLVHISTHSPSSRTTIASQR
jgi:SRSO17 transposase